MKLTILGYGAWGLCQAWLFANNFDEICVWGRNVQKINEFNNSKQFNSPYSIKFPDNINFTSNINKAILDSNYIILCVASSGIREVLNNLKLNANQILINASKGLEFETLKTISQVIEEIFPKQRYAILSGPTLSSEILDGKPTAACIACKNINLANDLQKIFNVPSKFRLYASNDTIGVELGGSLKNVIAIASGFANAMNLGENAKGSLITRGIAEIVRVAKVYGANIQTLYGLSGLGDLIATASSPQSRNFKVGQMLGQGMKIDDILKTLGQVAEGVKTSKAICEIGKKYNIQTPISNAIYEAIYTDISPIDVLNKLMNRKLKDENEL